MKQTKNLFTLLMTVVMMVMSPTRAWATNDDNDSTTKENPVEITLTYIAGTSGIGDNEGAASLIDGEDDTKWCSYFSSDNKPYIIFKTNVLAKLTGYSMVHGNDTPIDQQDRAWAAWTIYGANFDRDAEATAESSAWVEVDRHSGFEYGSDYSFSNLTSKHYQYYKLVIDVCHDKAQQMAEIHFTFSPSTHQWGTDGKCTECRYECLHILGEDGNCAICNKELSVLKLGENTIDINEGNGYTMFYFKAPEDGLYAFETTGEEFTEGASLAEDGTVLVRDSCFAEGFNFRLVTEVQAGNVVNLGVREYHGKSIPGYTLLVQKHYHIWEDDYCTVCSAECHHSDMEVLGHSDATCTRPAGTTKRCKTCSKIFFTPDKDSDALGHNIVNGVCTRCEKPVAIAVTTGSGTQQFVDFQYALPVAIKAYNPTITLLTDVTLADGEEIIIDTENNDALFNITLDLNGKKISGNSKKLISLSHYFASLTITDNTADKKGMMENSAKDVLYVSSGKLYIEAGTFLSQKGCGLNKGDVYGDIYLAGGRFVTLEGEYAILGSSILQEGYAYYKTGTDEIIDDDVIIEGNDITVMRIPVKATVTIEGEDPVDYFDFHTAFNDALTAERPVTIKLQKDYILPADRHYNIISDVTLDLNGKTITGKASSLFYLSQKTCKFTIDDSSTDKTGRIMNTGSDVVYVDNATLVVHAGTLQASSGGYAVVVASPNSTVSLDGGRYISPRNAIYKGFEENSLLADGYGFFHTETNAEYNGYHHGNTGTLCDANGTYATDVIVRLRQTPDDEITLALKDESHDPIVISKQTDGSYATDQVVDFTSVTNLSVPVDFVANNGVIYDRSLTALTGSDWGTLCLPFDIPFNAATGVTFYTLASVTSEGVTITAVTSGTIAAGTPMLFKKGGEATSLGISTTTATAIKPGAAVGSAANGGMLKLRGTFVPKYVNSGYYLDAADGMLHSIYAWSQANHDVYLTIPAFRAWFEGSVVSGDYDGLLKARTLDVIIDDEATSLDALRAVIEGTALIYGLDGQLRSELQQGVNIVKGKKVIVK